MLRIAGIIALVAVIGFSMIACDNGNDPGGGDLDLSGTITITPNSSVQTGTELTATYSGSEAVSYQWRKDGGNVGTSSNKYTPTEAGSYTVTVSATGYNPKTSAAITVTASLPVDPRPQTPEAMSTKTAMQYFTDEGIKIGINAGNSLDAVDSWTNAGKPFSIETAWGNPKLNQAYFNGLKTLGFNIVRVPVTWIGHIGSAPNYKIEEAWLARVAEVVGYAKNAGFKVFINIHHDGHHEMGGGGWLDINKAMANETQRAQIAAQYEAVWKQIAEYFINYGDYLMFQGFNEIHDGSWDQGNGADATAKYAIINNWNQRFTDTVRGTGGNNAKRYLIYYGYMTSHTIAEAGTKFTLPADTGNTGRQIIAFHYYQPSAFSLQQNGGTLNWGTSAEKSAIDSVFGNFRTKYTSNGVPVIIGENGPSRYVDNSVNFATAKTNRLAYIDYMYGKARENGLVPCYWENGSYSTSSGEGDFSLINRSNGQANSAESTEIIQHMITAINNATPPVPGTKIITINPNVYDAGDGRGETAHGYQAKISLSELLGGSIEVARGDTFNLTYTFTSNVAIGNLQVILADTRPAVSYWNELSGYVDIGAVTVGTPVNGTKAITATATAGDSSNDANQFALNIGENDSTASAPTLTFTALTLVKN
jgi:endoglucanase